MTDARSHRSRSLAVVLLLLLATVFLARHAFVAREADAYPQPEQAEGAALMPHLQPLGMRALLEMESENLTCSTLGNAEGAIQCSDGLEYLPKKVDHGWRRWVDLGVAAGLVCIAGLMSGLTMGLMSLDTMQVHIIMTSGEESARVHAQRVMPLVKRHHLLLVTLLMANALAMEALPLVLDRMVPSWAAVLLSVTAVLFFGEIIPQAICTRYGLAIGSYLSWLVWILIAVFFVISWPLSKILDGILGGNHSTRYRRAELKELVGMHGVAGCDDPTQTNREMLSEDEIKIIKGALDMRDKKAGSAMTPISKVAMLNFDGVLDRKTMEWMVQVGHSRFPVYKGDHSNVLGMLLVKRTILVNPDERVAIRDQELVRLPTISTEVPLYELLDIFQTGKSHMALVVDPTDLLTVLGIITLEDVVEELIQEEIIDETDVYEDVAKQIPLARALVKRKALNEPTSTEVPLPLSYQVSAPHFDTTPMSATPSTRVYRGGRRDSIGEDTRLLKAFDPKPDNE